MFFWSQKRIFIYFYFLFSRWQNVGAFAKTSPKWIMKNSQEDYDIITTKILFAKLLANDTYTDLHVI